MNMKLKLKYNPHKRKTWPVLAPSTRSFPAAFDDKAPKHASNYAGNSVRMHHRNKGGHRSECTHGATGHGPCSCVNK